MDTDTVEKETKPVIPTKSSMEILSELFSTFHAEPPLIVKREKTGESKKHKKKKKHKSKDKKHKKKSKKRKRDHSGDDTSSENDSSSELEFDLSKLLVKREKESDEKKIKIEGTDISLSLDKINDIIPDADEKDMKPLINKSHNENIEENNHEEGEIPEDDQKHYSKSRKHHRHKCKKGSKEKSDNSNDKLSDSNKCETKTKHHHRSRSGDSHRKDSEEVDSFYKVKEKDDFRSDRRRSRSPHRHSNSRHKEKEEHRDYRSGERHSRHNSFYDRTDDFYKPKERETERSYDRSSKNDFYKPRDRSFDRNRDDRWYSSKRSWDQSKDRKYRDRSWSPEEESSHIDKKKLLEIARKNAIQMMKSGSLPGALTLGPQAQEKVIAAIKAGGKTIEELTDFCKTLSKKEDLGELSDIEEEKGSESDNDKPFNHPFQIKDRPTSITMNIKNSVPLPIKSTQERTTELRMQFPVSSGQHHRVNEHEWVPVQPKKDAAPAPKASITLTKEVIPITPMVPPVNTAPLLSTIPVPPSVPAPEVQQSSIDISAIVSQRLTAMRKLQENPHDVQALTQMYKSTKEVQSWAESKQQPGMFTGSVGGNFLSQSELSSGYQAWAKKDQLQHAAPVSGGMGMHLLQKMGWKPGEGLGKEKTGALEPLLLEVKLDKRGLVANEETQKKKKAKPQQSNAKVAQGKHPVSLLGEYACKNKLGAPTYELCFECGPDHKKNFLFKVILNGMECKPNVASPNKKEAKANAAALCLQKLGIVT